MKAIQIMVSFRNPGLAIIISLIAMTKSDNLAPVLHAGMLKVGDASVQ